LWPAELVDRSDAERARGVLVHELAHLRRRDHWVIWLEMVAACLWWWNPLFWYVRRRLRHSAELACDAWVVWALPEGRRAYAESLIDVVERSSRNRAVAPAWAAFGENRRYFERRLTMIYQAKVQRRLSRGGLLAIGLLALAVLPGWSHRRLVGQEAEAPPGETASERLGAEAAEEERKAEAGPAASTEALATEQVLVVLQDIPAGEAITPEMLKIEEWPSDKVPSGATTRLEDVVGRRARTKIWSGTPILAEMLARPAEVLVSVPHGYRVITVSQDEASATRDLIRPGDHVDVLWAPRDKADEGETEPRAVLEDIQVFAVHDAGQASAGGRRVSLLVTPQQAEKLTLATEIGRIWLAQRPSTEWRRPQPPQKTIEVFRLAHRDPAEMMEIVTALFRLVAGKEELPAREVTVLAVVRRSGRYGDMYGGEEEMYGGEMTMGGSAMGMMPGGAPRYPGGFDGRSYGEGMDEYDGSGYPRYGSRQRGLPELRLTVDRRTKALIARADPEAMEIVRKLVGVLDTPDDSLPGQIEKLPGMRLVKFRHRATEEMARVLHELGINVQVTQVPIREGDAVPAQGGTLIVVGGEADLDQIGELIGTLDVDPGRRRSGAGPFPGAGMYPGAGAPSGPGGPR
jgi:Flp pilus assembly protein CpaB